MQATEAGGREPHMDLSIRENGTREMQDVLSRYLTRFYSGAYRQLGNIWSKLDLTVSQCQGFEQSHHSAGGPQSLHVQGCGNLIRRASTGKQQIVYILTLPSACRHSDSRFSFTYLT